MDKIAEIKEAVQDLQKAEKRTSAYRKAVGKLELYSDEWIPFLLSELERKDKYMGTFENIRKVAEETIRKLQEERDSWERVARLVEEEKQSAQQEIDRLKKQDADVIINYALERQKLIEGLRIIIKTSECPATVQRAYLILGEIGVTE